jgi:hypothetical protein
MNEQRALAVLDLAARLAAAAHPKLGGDVKTLFRDLVKVVEAELHRLASEHRADGTKPADGD